MSKKVCSKCGSITYDGDYCIECGNKLSSEHNGFFDNINEKLSLSSLIFSFIILGLFLFIGSLFWGIFTSNGIIGFSTNVILTVIFAVFFGGLFVGYTSCGDNSYIVPNFLAYLGTIIAFILCIFGGLFALVTAFSAALSSVFPSSTSNSGYGSSSLSSTNSNDVSSF